jgi:hypothetical protein
MGNEYQGGEAESAVLKMPGYPESGGTDMPRADRETALASDQNAMQGYPYSGGQAMPEASATTPEAKAKSNFRPMPD